MEVAAIMVAVMEVLACWWQQWWRYSLSGGDGGIGLVCSEDKQAIIVDEVMAPGVVAAGGGILAHVDGGGDTSHGSSDGNIGLETVVEVFWPSGSDGTSSGTDSIGGGLAQKHHECRSDGGLGHFALVLHMVLVEVLALTAVPQVICPAAMVKVVAVCE